MASFDQTQIDAILKQIAVADLQVLATQLIPALFVDVESFIPAQYQAIAKVVLDAAEPAAQAAFSAMIAKIQP
jgi:hypothetical protein